MNRSLYRLGFAVLAIALALGLATLDARASDKQVARGKYLVTIGGCNDCHTPGALLGKPDFARALGGSEVGFEVPKLGVFYGPNLTPDKDTGIGTWTAKQIVAAITTGKTPEGRELAPVMPWRALSQLKRYDAYAIAAYLKSLPPISNKVPGPFGPTQKPTSFVFRIVPPSP